MAKIKPDYELEQTKIKLLKQENKLGFLQNMIKANALRIESLKAQSASVIESLENTLTEQRIHEVEYQERIKGLRKYMEEMLDLQQPKRKAKPKKTTKKKTKKKKKTKAQLAAEKAAKKAAFEAEMEALKEEEAAEEEEMPGEEESQTETTI